MKRVDWRRWAPWAIGGVLMMLLLVWLARRYLPGYRAGRTARRRERAESELAYFTRAERACRSSDMAAAYRALAAWARRAGAASLTAWCDETGDGALGGQAVALERALFAVDPAAARTPALPALNP